jgi:hypothetical protein
MALIQVTRATLGNKRLKPRTSFAFAAQVPFCSIVASEFGAIATSYPIFFLEQDGAFSPIALLSLADGRNLFVEADGGWSGGYVPAFLRRYPFGVQPNAEGIPGLVIDEDCGLLSDTEGEPLFGHDEQSDQASPVGQALQLISQLDLQVPPTRAVIAKIAETGIIQPITLGKPDGAEQQIGGLFAINETSLNALSDQTLVALRKDGALSVIYSHLVSLGHVPTLNGRAALRRAMAEARKRQN